MIIPRITIHLHFHWGFQGLLATLDEFCTDTFADKSEYSWTVTEADDIYPRSDQSGVASDRHFCRYVEWHSDISTNSILSTLAVTVTRTGCYSWHRIAYSSCMINWALPEHIPMNLKNALIALYAYAREKPLDPPVLCFSTNFTEERLRPLTS